jgi:uncharacterized protein Smg (DUF494 family)
VANHYEAEKLRAIKAATRRRADDLAARNSHDEVSLRVDADSDGFHLVLILYRARRHQDREMVTLEDVHWKTPNATEDEIISWAVRALMRHASIQLELPFG